jgi:hypothetical protein
MCTFDLLMSTKIKLSTLYCLRASAGHYFGQHVLFSALSTMTGSLGQATYTSSNAVLDAHSTGCRHSRPDLAAKTIMWGAVGSIGMRWKSFASYDLLGSATSPSECLSWRIYFLIASAASLEQIKCL